MTMTDTPPSATPDPPSESTHRPRAVWVILALGIIMFLVGGAGGSYEGKLGEVQKNDSSSFLPDSADSTKVANASDKFVGSQSIPGSIVYERKGGLTDADKAKIQRDIAAFRGAEGVSVAEIRPVPAISSNGEVAAVSVPLRGKDDQGKTVQGTDLVDREDALLDIAKKDANGLKVYPSGATGLLTAFIGAFDGLDTNLLFSAGIVVIIILLFVYRSPVLWFFPLFSAVLALGVSALVIYPLAKNEVITLDGQSQGILSVLVIGAGTDYALLLISRYREELHLYQSRLQAMIAAWKGAAPAIIASAMTVILGLICLSFAELNSTAGLGPVCAIGIAATVIVMLTLLPTLLVISGRWIFWPKRPMFDREADVMKNHGVWGRFARTLAGGARRSWIGAAVVLIACAALVTTLKTDGLSTQDGFTTKPDAVIGQEVFDAAFPSNKGQGAPAQILANADKSDEVIAAAKRVQGISREADGVCVALNYGKISSLTTAQQQQLAQSANQCPPSFVQATPRDGKILIDAQLTSSFDSTEAYATVERLRSTLDSVAGADALVGGQSAANLDVQQASRHDRNLIIPIVLAVILVVLALLLRALIAPLLLILTVVLSFLAALGVSAFFFNNVFDFANADPGYPLFAFVFLVALGIDYNIFLMTRVREETVRHGTKEGITRGLAVTGGVITSAGLVLAATFVVLGVLPIVFLAQIGFTVAFGVLLDTFVVRSILVPALAHDIGKKIWWPSKLAAAGAKD